MIQTEPDLARLRIDRDRPPPARSRHRRRALYAAIGALIVAAIALVATRVSAPAKVRIATAEQRGGATSAGSTGVTANGYVVARTKASVSSKITGRLAYLGVEEGSVVREGEIIARLESADYAAALGQRQAERATAGAALAQAEVQRDQLRRDVRRAEDLLSQGLLSDQEAERLAAQLEEAEANVRLRATQVEAADAVVAVAKANLENTYIRAPFSGTVLRKDAEVGEVVAPSVTGGGLTRGAVVTMADLKTLEVEVDVNESYISRIEAGQPAIITLDAYPDTAFRGSVRQVVPTADRQKATVLVKVSISDRDPRILPEMGAKVEFLSEAVASGPTAPSRVFVPAVAVRDEEGRQVAWVVREGRVERREVEAAPVTGGWREVRRGLATGDRVVVAGPATLRDGQRVQVEAGG